MNSNASNNIARLKKGAIAWLVIVIGLILILGYLLPISRINSSVLSLLPKEQVSDIPESLMAGFQERLDKQLVFLIKPEPADDLTPVKYWYDHLKQQSFITDVNGYFDDHFQQDWREFAYQYRYQLTDHQIIEQLGNGDHLAWVLSQVYSPFAGVSAAELNHDPLLLTRATQLNQLNQAGHLSVNQNWLTVDDEQGHKWYMIYAELNTSTFNMNQSHQIVDQLNQLSDDFIKQWPETQLLKRGVLFYSDSASRQAKHDISTISTVSMIGILILIVSVFHSIRPILLTLLSILVGILCGVVAVFAIFGEIHIITLVMSTSIIGVAIDYALHYLTERLIHGHQDSAYQSLVKLRRTLTLALGTSLMAYLILLFTPFPGLKQLSVFAIFGLVGAFLSVIYWYPFLVNRLPVRPNVGQKVLCFWLSLWQKKSMQLLMISCAVIFIGYGAIQLKIDDDIGRLQTLPIDLKQQEQAIVNITKQTTDQKWFIVHGRTQEQTLQRLASFLPLLENAKEQGIFGEYQTINLPSQYQQQQNIVMIEKYAPVIINALNNLGMNIKLINFELTKQEFVTPDEWQKSAISQGRKLLWYSLSDGESATLVPISQIYKMDQLKALSNSVEGVTWLDRRADFNQMFTDYRFNLSILLGVAVMLISGSFIYRNFSYGFKMALKSTLPTLLSVGCAIATLGIVNQPLNLFALLALILVIGIGIDYSLFLSNHRSHSPSSLLAVLMAAITTLLSFGLLVLSHTSAIVGFGLVLVGGIFSAFLFAPLAIKPLLIEQQKKEI